MASLHWFRKGLRLHDNPAFNAACKASSTAVYPVFIVDPYFANPDFVGINRYAFLLESLQDLDSNLRHVGNRLFVLNGKPEEQLLQYVEKWNIKYVTFEKDTEPYAIKRDLVVISALEKCGVQVNTFVSHTLHDINLYTSTLNGKICNNYGSFGKLFSTLKKSLRQETQLLTSADIPSPPKTDLDDINFHVPSLAQMGYTGQVQKKLVGGETEALKRLHNTVVSRSMWVSKFEKPETSPNSIDPSTTVLAPYLKFGCLSVLHFYNILEDIHSKSNSNTEPPVSLHGQLLWREFFYYSSVAIPNFDKVEGNLQCKRIPWDHDPALLDKWKNAQTGYPYIDAIMTQLKQEGWIHHLARHSVACFLTRGDLWQSWVEGAKVFDLFLLDADWALNNANWQWLSCSNFFYQYWRCYSPVVFGKKTDPDGNYIRHYLPQLAKYPSIYIYEPWKAPSSVQKECGCVIGVDYPNPIVTHEIVSQVNMEKMKIAYNAQAGDTVTSDQPTESSSSNSNRKRVVGSIKQTSSSKETASKLDASSTSSSKPSKSPKIDHFFTKK